MDEKRITEAELILPALYFLSLEADGSLATGQLIAKLTGLMKPAGVDAQILAGRRDTYFSQKVRNLKSHATLSRNGWAEETGDGFRISPAGRAFAEANREAVERLLGDEFEYRALGPMFADIAKKPKRQVFVYDENETVTEGTGLTGGPSKSRERSQKLRAAAREHFGDEHGNLRCAACGFDFEACYGEGIACIEIHHMKPIYQYEDADTKKTIAQALKNLIPLCPNCHRFVHRNHIGAEEIGAFCERMQKRATGVPETAETTGMS